MDTIRIERARFTGGYAISLSTGDAFKDACGVSHGGRGALDRAWSDLAANTGRTLKDLKALERKAPYLRVRR